MITRADIVGRSLELGGYLYAKDFPEIVREIAKEGKTRRDLHGADARSRAAGCLAMSYEIADASVADMRAEVWTLTKVTFTGAAILRREKAAYRRRGLRWSSN